MNKLFFRLIFFLLISLIFLMTILSTTGIKTDKFNNIILKKINNNYKDTSLKLGKIKFKFDIKKVSLFVETKNPEINYQNTFVPIENVKIYLNFLSLLKSKIDINKINISSEEITIKELKDLIIKVKPSNITSLIINKVKSGKLNTNLDLYFDNNLKIVNFIAKGEVKEMRGYLTKNLVAKGASFNFFFDKSDLIIKNTKMNLNGILLKSGNLYLTRGDNINLKSEFSTDIKLDKNNLKSYSFFLNEIKFKNNFNNLNVNLDHVLNIKFDKTLKVLDYEYNNKGNVENFSYNLNIPKNDFIPQDIKTIELNQSDIEIKYHSDKNYTVYSKGKYKLNNGNLQNFELTNNSSKVSNDLDLSFETNQELNIDLINFQKKDNGSAKVNSKISIKKDIIIFKEIEFKQNKNLIILKNFKISKKKLVSLQNLKVKTFINSNVNNDFEINIGKKISVKGKKYDAENLSKILSKKSNSNFFSNINKDVEISINNISTPLSREIFKFRLLGRIEKGKFIKISSKGDFGNNKFLDISMKSDKENKKKFLEIYSDLPQPLLSNYNFFKGVSGGVLIFSSIMEDETSNSKLTIENFKVVNAPGVIKLLSLADFGGLADLAEGDGLSFDKLEINMNNEKDLLTLEELFAIGPSISVLMEGYKDKNGLVSLRGTLVPAKNLNNFLSKIPVIGKIIIPKDVGEGLFGVSFKMKGPPGKIKTTINPIKTLTPRFISKALEKSKASK